MPNYLKPQSPLKDKDGDYIYPLTTADQVIMGNGSRLVEDIESFVNTKINEKVISRKSRNLLPILNTSKTVDGVTYTVNPDRSITINGTANGESTATISAFEFWGHSYWVYKPVPITFPKGSKLIASYENNGCGFYAILQDGTGLTGVANINAALANSDCTFISLAYFVEIGTTVNNVTIYPMILAPGDTDETYEPYYNGLANITESPVMSMDLLWENSSPTSDFAEQQIIISKTYEWYVILGAANGSNNITIIRNGCNSLMMGFHNNMSYRIMLRYVNANITDRIGFSDAVYYNTYADSSQTQCNNMLIPYQIYGIKGVN